MDSTIISKAFTFEEAREIASRLENHDAIFSQLWQIGSQFYSNEIDTACVSFDEVGEVLNLQVNPVFWKACSQVKKEFVICHEMLHVLLEHGRRAKDSPVINHDANNVSMDVVVNELLVSSFGFDRKEIDPKSDLCWVDTIFKDRTDVLTGQTFEYYLNKLPKVKCNCGSGKSGKGCSCPMPGKMGGKVLDDHSKLKPVDVGKMLERAAARMSQQEREDLLDKLGQEGSEASNSGKQRGSTSGNLVQIMSGARSARKRKWETVIKKCLKKIADSGSEETWIASRNRRLASLAGSKVLLPTEVDGEGLDNKRAVIYFFLDTSGSCSGLAKRFWKLATSVPLDTFDIKLRCFDTKVFKVNFKDKKLYGFGGTSFHILENHIQSELKNGGRYPDGVFVLTDGYGTKVTPQFPKRWHVLNTTNYNECFPPGVNKYDLADFE